MDRARQFWAVITILAVMLIAPAAFAQAIGGYTLDPGPWIDTAVEVVVPTLMVLLTAIFAWVKSKIPTAIMEWLHRRNIDLEQRQIEALARTALQWAANRVKGAEFAKPVRLDVANAMVIAALEWFDDPQRREFVKRYGRRFVEQMLMSRIPLHRDEAIDKLLPVMPATRDPALGGFIDPHRG